ncbi:sensor histidine kinase [Streptomyces sp. NPDC096176]|uniref:sensor histidine kinase n=1 Tax=Streptomyces sp. NPDC096176 TaxID=3366079 RepID=UPI0037FC4185
MGIRGWRGRWRERSKLQKIDLYSRLTLCVMVWFLMASWGLLPLISAVKHQPLPLALGAALVVVSVAQCVVSNRITGPALDHYLGKAVLPRRRLALPLALLAVAVALITALRAVDGVQDGMIAFLLTQTPLAFTIPYALLVPVRVLLLRYTAFTAVLFALFAVVGMRGGELAGLLLMALITCGMTLVTVRPAAWSLQVMWQAEEARDVQARLAVAEERLRFGRDMHDVLGRNLAVVALKSELAVQLAQRGRPEAVAQMLEVQRIAQESQKELREVVRGYREADLAVELEGARSVLAAAGINCAVSGADSADGLPARAQSALGWVVREAATNVLRHGDPRTCAVRLSISSATAVLVVENDGLGGDAPAVGGGSGITGLRERLATLGGTLDAGPVGGGMFRLTAQVPR